jgi:PPK2 family polyphosphate:nucleotide phosphotransferase
MAKKNKPDPGAGDPLLAPWRFDAPGMAVDLRALDPGATPYTLGSKAKDQQRVDALALELDAVQNLLFACRRHKLLVVLQGTDTSGKDGTLRTVFGRMSPLGVRTAAWKAPTEEERAHDFLWRIHRQVPAAGEIMVFNRSHYEDVLVPVASGSLPEAQLLQRYAQINDFERLLCETGTVLVKFMLHISKEEQRRRLQDRIDDPAKRWKFQREDLAVRALWDTYQAAYARAISATATPHAPWIVVPADSKTHRNLMIATVLLQVLQDLDLKFPDDPAIAHLHIS